MQTNHTNPALIEEISAALSNHPDAKEFILLYSAYVHRIDDIIDEPEKRSDPEFMLQTFQLAADVFSCDFYHKHRNVLRPTEFLINNTYADSVQWERSSEIWKRQEADVLRHTAIDMFLLVTAICLGRDATRKISLRFREYAHKCQKDYSETNLPARPVHSSEAA